MGLLSPLVRRHATLIIHKIQIAQSKYLKPVTQFHSVARVRTACAMRYFSYLAIHSLARPPGKYEVKKTKWRDVLKRLVGSLRSLSWSLETSIFTFGHCRETL